MEINEPETQAQQGANVTTYLRLLLGIESNSLLTISNLQINQQRINIRRIYPPNSRRLTNG